MTIRLETRNICKVFADQQITNVQPNISHFRTFFVSLEQSIVEKQNKLRAWLIVFQTQLNKNVGPLVQMLYRSQRKEMDTEDDQDAKGYICKCSQCQGIIPNHVPESTHEFTQTMDEIINSEEIPKKLWNIVILFQKNNKTLLLRPSSFSRESHTKDTKYL